MEFLSLKCSRFCLNRDTNAPVFINYDVKHIGITLIEYNCVSIYDGDLANS